MELKNQVCKEEEFGSLFCILQSAFQRIFLPVNVFFIMCTKRFIYSTASWTYIRGHSKTPTPKKTILAL
jgi:hypothetical protein